MKRLLLIAFLTALVSLAAYGQDCSGAKALQKHIYKPDRLKEVKGCVTVRGVIMKKILEKDGDFHIRLKLDTGEDSDLINARNKAGQDRFLVFEPICVVDVVQASARKACNVKNKKPTKHGNRRLAPRIEVSMLR